MMLFGREITGNIDGAQFSREIERLLWHLGFEGVTNVDGAGDRGGDIVADRFGERYVLQCKYKSSGAVSEKAVQEVISGLQAYDGTHAVVVTNVTFTKSAEELAAQYRNLTGASIFLWGAHELEKLWRAPECQLKFGGTSLRPYQAEAYSAITHDLKINGSALLILATGLGKTVVAGNCIEWFLSRNPGARVLVVAHAIELVNQLERALWKHLDKLTPTQQLTGDSKPHELSGVTCATVATALKYVENGYKPDFIFVDEAHHVGEKSQFVELLAAAPQAMSLGVTATPWRGDQFDIETVFGKASYKLGIEEGMQLGFLCDVDYKVYLDNIDWEFVREISNEQLSIADLNSRLFLPQRDERIRDELLSVWNSVSDPRAIVFCQTVEHAKRMHAELSRVQQWSNAQIVHSDMHKRDRQINLMDFRSGKCSLLIAVDVLNEGVDVPDVNVVCFARVTHSRRIFVQQLGRGLRLSPDKKQVVVLDFVSDLRRVASLLQLRRNISSEPEEVHLPSNHRIEFENANAESLMTEWLKDAASVETANEQARLNFLGSLTE